MESAIVVKKIIEITSKQIKYANVVFEVNTKSLKKNMYVSVVI